MTSIKQEDLIQSVADALQFISFYHPADYIRHLAKAYAIEKSDAARDAIAQILTNSRMCAEGKRPICQDTGIVNVFLKIGMNVRWSDATLSVEQMISESFKMKQAPYAGTAQMTTDIIGYQVPLGALAVATVAQHIKSGRLKALAVTTAKRSSSLPTVPSVAEQGIKGFDVQSWVGLLAPATTPDATVAQIYADIATVANTSGFIEQMQGQGMELDLKNPAQFKTYIAAEVSKWTTVVKEAGIKP